MYLITGGCTLLRLRMNTLKLLYWRVRASCLYEEKLLNYCKRLEKDEQFLTKEGTLNEKLVDKIVLHLYRIYPQILNNAEAEMFRNVNTPVSARVSELLLHLQNKNNRACKEFYNALETNDAQIYQNLPSKCLAKTTGSVGVNMDTYSREKYILNDRVWQQDWLSFCITAKKILNLKMLQRRS
ncbi:caspase recruitment domain family, member 19 isoform X4 [Carcharodon carcharias]|uniref:caspase recruitment domain family, member 19 isoform X4 n=1 Tax=Carcharodon carcharias TaxID=13397 RepID=UPI001B7E0959|nr:caspase recruitment domain family, member 19 isoform X4 [Carcharodon carcharias]